MTVQGKRSMVELTIWNTHTMCYAEIGVSEYRILPRGSMVVPEEFTQVEYKTFSQHVLSGDVSDLTIYDFMSEIEVVYKHDGVVYGAGGPYGPIDDALLHSVLDEQGITYTILKEEYDGAGPMEGMETMMSVIMGSFFIVPAVMLIIILIQAITIRRLSDKIPPPLKSGATLTGVGE